VVRNRLEIETQIRFLRANVNAEGAANIQQIEDGVDTYLKAIDSVTDTAYSKDARRILDDALEWRQTIVHVTAALSDWNDSNFETEQKDIERSIRNLRAEIVTILALITFLGTAAGCAALYRISEIQKSNQLAHGKITEAQEKLKLLSRQLVSAQELERKALSRELHDEIGQSLTALKLELAHSEKIARTEGSGVTAHLQTIREIADHTLRATKNIALGLRPPMLDDLGLLSALNWLTADFSKRTGIAVEASADGEISRLNEAYRTCIYRVVQESLTNCARHSQARCVTVQLDISEERLTLTVNDDGTGFEPGKKIGAGLGLLSMQERAAELGGTFEIGSAVGKGTRIQVTIPTLPVAVRA
jgi:signal transduction histidine kinase